MIRSPAGFGGGNRIKRYLDYYQPSYGVMMLAEGLFGFSTPAGVLLGDETSGVAIDFTSTPTSTLVRTANSLSTNYYSGLPFQNDGNGPVTFSRTSNATVTDSDGKIKWAGHNLLLASEQFDASSWTKTTTTVSANSVASPNGTMTADTLTAGGANSTALQSYTALNVAYTFGVWLKRKTGTGNIQIAADSGTWNTVTLTTDWTLFTVSQTPAAGSISAGVRIATSGDEVYAWGAHLYRSDLGGMQANSSAYPMYNPTTPKNLLGYTETFSTGWTATNATSSASTEQNPNGIAVCRELTATVGNGTLLGSLSLLATPYTFSIWIKRKTGSGNIDITVDGTTYVTVAVTTSWTRFSTTLTPTAGTKTPGVRIVTSGDAVYLWGAQLSNSASLDAYVPNYFAAPSAAAYYGPRLDYNPSTLAPNGLLVEEQRTNLLLQSAAFDNASWIKNGLNPFGSGSVANTTATLSPAGAFDADFIQEDTSAGTHEARQVVTVTSGVAYTASIYVKSAGRTAVQFQYFDGTANAYPIFNLATGTLIAANGADATSITSVGNGWYRISLVKTSASTSAVIYIYTYNGTTNSYAGDGTSGIYVWGAQLEAGTFTTSYIPTSSATATRAADVASVSTQAFPYSSTEGSWVANFQTLFSGTAPASSIVLSADGSLSKRIAQIAASTDVASTLDTSGTISATGDVTGSVAKVGSAYDASNRYIVANGGTVASGTIASGYRTASSTVIGGVTGSNYLNGHIRQITYLPRRLSNAELQQRTSA